MTSSDVAVLNGSQQPRVDLVPDHAWSQVDDASFFSSAYGLTPDPWQALVLTAWLAQRSDKRWAASRAGLAVPRQNGKNAALEIRELYGMVALGERFLHTAHEVKTARKAFLRLAGFFENVRQWPELAGLVESIRKTNGQEAIVLTNGGSVEFVARSRGSGRGYTVDVLVADEAQELTDEHIEALLPTISSSPSGNPQVLLTGTPPPPGTAAAVFARMRADAHAGNDAKLSWHEWSVDGDEVDLDDRELWAATNPALGTRLNIEVVETERTQLSDDGFARERLGSWSKTGTQSVIPLQVWEHLADRMSRPDGPVVFAADATPDRSSASIATAGRRADGLWHIEVFDNRKGMGWVVERAAEVQNRWGGVVMIDPAGPIGSLLPAFMEAGVTVETVTARELGQACGAFYDDAMEGRLRHLDQPLLNVALGAARRRSLGDAWAWHRKDATDISPLVAATLARHAAAVGASTPPVDSRMFVFR